MKSRLFSRFPYNSCRFSWELIAAIRNLAIRAIILAILFYTPQLGMAGWPEDRLDPEYKQILQTIWANRKQYLTDNLNNGLAANNTNSLYNTQGYTNNLLKYAHYCQDYAILDGLAELYLVAYNHLDLRTTYWYYYLPTYGRGPTELTLDPPARMWTTSIDTEVILHSSQFLYAVANAINIILDVDSAQRTANMNNLISTYVPVLLVDHYQRWVFGAQGMFQVAGWGCGYGMYNHSQFLQAKEARTLGTYVSFCNAIGDTDMWIVAGVTEILAAHAKDPLLIPLSAADEQAFSDYLDVAHDLIADRLSTKA